MTDHGAKLLQASEDASFECGEWSKDDDEPYDGVYARSAAAHEALAAYIEALEAALRSLVEWDRLTGSWEGPAWEAARALVDGP